MNKYELKSKVRRNLKGEVTGKDVKLVVDEVFNVIMDELAEGNEINIKGFGRFMTKFHPGYMGANPQDLTQAAEIKDHHRVYFKSGTVLKRKVNKWEDEE